MKAETYTYQEALDIVEKFMERTEIRGFCTYYCKGSCCRGCYNSGRKGSCKVNGRKISCSMYLCDELHHLIFSKRESHIVDNLRRAINKNLRIAGHRSDIYFDVFALKMKGAFKISQKKINRLNKIDTLNIRRKLWSVKGLVAKARRSDERGQ